MFDPEEPVILKEGSSAKEQLAAFEALIGTLPPDKEERLQADIRALRAGIIGEERVLFELKNSHMGLFVLQDLFLEHEGLSAQIDFLVITSQRSFVIECKNLYGDIEVTSKGDFIRKLNSGQQEGLYSPITQNQRHIELIHAMRKASRSLIENLMLDGDFEDVYRSLVVLANPKTVIDAHLADEKIRSMIIRADQLVATIQAINAERGPGKTKRARSAIRKSAQWFLEQHKERGSNYAAKYKTPEENDTPGTTTHGTILCPLCGAPMVLRTAKRGERAGKQFYGCSTYPKCRGIVNVE